ncbi:MAG: methylglyoxal synthase [Chloroflexota bacterium]|jgi:methylglyoxal synthase
MEQKSITIKAHKNIALVAHDNKKDDLLEWTEFNLETLRQHTLFATGTTGWLLAKKLNLEITRLQSGPLGGDQQLGAKISQGEIDILIFFWDPLEAQPHDPDVRALLRIATVWNIPVATTRATADFIISSPLLNTEYAQRQLDFGDYQARLSEQYGLS